MHESRRLTAKSISFSIDCILYGTLQRFLLEGDINLLVRLGKSKTTSVCLPSRTKS